MTDERARAVAFLRDLELKCSTREERVRWGRALFNDDFPVVRDLNFVRVEQPASDIDAEALAAEAERVQGSAGLAHRKVTVDEESLGERLVAGFEKLGWQSARLLLMAHHRPPDKRSPQGVAREIDLDGIKRARQASLDEEGGHSAEVAAQLRDMVEVVARAGEARFFGAEAGGEIVSMCELYLGAGMAQIEAVTTLERHRGKGLARAVVLAALDAARRAGCEFVFLTAEFDDWPRQLYSKLGFDPIGSIYDFTLTEVP